MTKEVTSDPEADALFERVATVISESLGLPRSMIVGPAKFKEDMNADSLELVTLVVALEDEFKVEISDEVAEKCLTVDDTVTLIASFSPPRVQA